MLEAVQLYGARQGMWLGTKRLCRCNPLGSHGFDPVPVNPILSTSAVTNRNHQQSPERACVEDNPDSCSIGEYKLNG